VHGMICCVESAFEKSLCLSDLALTLDWAITTCHRLHALPVVDANRGNLVGIVTAKDVMRDVVKTANKALPAEDTFSQSIADIPNLTA